MIIIIVVIVTFKINLNKMLRYDMNNKTKNSVFT